jgi:phenylpropionate dioxygenase-like ring-hydroxylating dioxygenase large terminal subunit
MTTISSAWTPLEFTTRARKITATPKKFTVNTKKYALFWDATSNVPIAVDDVCGHRGASLSSGGVVVNGCVKCKYHGHLTRPDPSRIELADRNGIIWIRDDDSSETSPPTSWEFDAASQQRYFEYSRKFQSCNPILTLENTLDFSHLETVHLFHLIDGRPHVEIQQGGLNGKATYTYQSKTFNLVIENEYWAPWSSCLRFIFDGEQAFTLHFSVRPESPDNCTVLVRVTRKRDGLGAFGDALYMAVNELPLWEDRYIVRNADATVWSKNKLTGDDAFLREYRKYMRENHADILSEYVQ